jgi:ATP-dependent Clp protease ATP-binding subunit ClpA
MAAQEKMSVSESRDRPAAQARFAPATKKALELSLREAVRRGDDDIGSEHLLLGLLRGADERTMTILNTAGVTPQAIRDAVDALPHET